MTAIEAGVVQQFVRCAASEYAITSYVRHAGGDGWSLRLWLNGSPLVQIESVKGGAAFVRDYLVDCAIGHLYP